jgi:hypothetical protein
VRLAGQSAALEPEHTAIGIRRHADPAFDRRRVQRCAAEQRMRALRQALGVEPIELGEQETGVANRVHADVPTAAVGGTTMNDHLDPHEAAMRRHHVEARRLAHDRRIGANASLEHRSCAEALVFLVGADRHDDLAGERTA